MTEEKRSNSDDQTAADVADDILLEQMGYKPTLFRGLGALANFAIGFTEVAVLPSIVLVSS